MIKSKKVFLFVFAFTFVGLSISLFLALNSIRGRYSLLSQVEKIPFEHRVQGINFDKQGNMWVSNSGSLYQYKDGSLIKEYQKNSAFHETGPITIVFDDKAQIWVATAQYDVAVLNKDQWTTIYTGASRVKRILSFSLDPNGNAWIGIEGEGIKVFDKTGKILNTYDVSNSILDSN
ncbi:MAG TPA: hypothetical protein VN843_05365, partial [Anaerolineales bacterium]|nr:hypothetical protein [Anaerolineales bacterium]